MTVVAPPPCCPCPEEVAPEDPCFCAKPATPPPPMSIYRRDLPASLADFCSPAGRAHFARALAAGDAGAFFPLSAHMQTQPFPAACGLTSLAVVLNALRVDPGRVWRAPWRWYEERALLCCSNEAQVRQSGVTLHELGCIARCHGLRARIHREMSDDAARTMVRSLVADRPSDMDGSKRAYLVVSFSRSAIRQTGSGHFSPVAAYDVETDSVLVLDTARFKYPPFWVSLSALNASTLGHDPATKRPRGWIVLSRDEGGDAPTPLRALANALERVCCALRAKRVWTAEDLAALARKLVGDTTFSKCMMRSEVPDAVWEEVQKLPLFACLIGEGKDKRREALVALACLGNCDECGLVTDEIAIPALGKKWDEMGEEFRAVVGRLSEAFRIAAGGMEASSVE